MNDYERIHYIHNKIKRRGYVTRDEVMNKFEITRSTFNRALDFMRSRLRAPIIYRREEPSGYIYDPSEETFELAGVWLTAPACHALIVMDNLLNEIVPTIPSYDPFQSIGAEIDSYLENAGYNPKQFLEKIQYKPFENRPQNPESFQRILEALLNSHQLHFTYHSRSKNETTTRTVSPQKLIHYRNNWYLTAWCHDKNELRTFAVENIHNARSGSAKAKLLPQEKLSSHIDSNFGIYAGGKQHTAHLRFSQTAARWVRDEIWHPNQKLIENKDGSLEMHLPYSNPQEISMEILRHTPEVKVLKPASLKKLVKTKLEQALKHYEQSKT